MPQAAPSQVKDCRIDLRTDSQVLIHTWQRKGSRSQELSGATKALFGIVSQRNLHLQLSHISSKENVADGPSRCLTKSDSMLSVLAWSHVQKMYGGRQGHSIDLMALASNAQRDSLGNFLPHFTPFAASDSAGVNLIAQLPGHADGIWRNAYVFPPFGLVGAVLRFLLPFDISSTIVVPVLSPLPVWWTVLRSESAGYFRLCAKNDLHTILYPSRQSSMPSPCPFDLWVFRIAERGV